jgi:diadenylate cyclase
MSEQCDAVVVVVSEETGIISVAQNGQLVRNVTSAALREMLLDVLVNSTKNEKIDTKKSKKGEKSNEENKS